MSTALYRRYRPESFADVIGQEHVTEPLMVALEKNRVNHAYLFSGPRGCGKTTSARILARCLNCAQGPTPTPCGQCDSCRDLARDGGGSLDVIEMDAASHGGVDHARDLRERASFAPVRDRYKIFIIDEAHMVTREGFNALLKIVEEPPAHIKFIFATTEPNKVLGTIRSRTHHYPFRLVPPETLHNYLSQLCAEEQVAVEPGVLQLVVRAGGGSVRDSLSILDQLMAGAGDTGITYDLAVALLGFTHGELLDGLVDALAKADASAVFKAVNTAIQSGQDPRRFVEDLLERFRDLLMLQAVPDTSQSVLRGLPEAQLRAMGAQAQQLTTAQVTRAAELTSQALNEMNGATNPQLTLELMCARIMLAAQNNAQDLSSRLERLEQRLDEGDFSAPAQNSLAGQNQATRPSLVAPAGHTSSAPAQPQAQAQAQRQQRAQPQAETQPPAPLQSAPLAGLRRPQQVENNVSAPQQSVSIPAETQQQQQEAVRAEGSGQNQVQPQPERPNPASRNLVELAKTSWPDVIQAVPSHTAHHWLKQCTPSKYDGSQLFIRATIDVLKMVKPHIQELEQALMRVLEVEVRVRAEVAKSGAGRQTPRQATQEPTQPVQGQAAPSKSHPANPAQSAVAEGPRAGEQAWAQHGQPRTQAAPQWSTDDWNNPVTSWDVAQIPSDQSANQPQQSDSQPPAEPKHPNETSYSDGLPAAEFAPSQTESRQSVQSAHSAEEPESHSLTEQVEGEVETISPNTEATDSQDARQSAQSQASVGTDASFRQVAEPTPAGESAHPRESAQSEPVDYYDGPEEPPYYEDEPEYISGADYEPASQQAPSPNQPVVEQASQPSAPAQGQDSGRKLSFRERHAAQIAAGARSAQTQQNPQAVNEPEDFAPSDEDVALEETVLIGQRAVEKILGGVVIDEKPLHG